MTKPLFLFVRPPRPLWPFNGPSTAFWPPLAFASLAAALREGVRDLEVDILDAPALEMGWRTLEAELRARAPAYVGIGEEAVSCVEGLRLAALARAVGACVVAGGCFFGHVAAEVLRTGLVDVVVHGEGEGTIVELAEALRTGRRQDLAAVAGITYADGEQIVRTPPRPLLPDLDRLPMPAYDLLPVGRYGRDSRNHPDFAAIELGRGCTGSCDFCVLWRQMGRDAGGRPLPQLRTKSADRLLEEIRVLTRRHGRRYLGWVDPSFNADPSVPGELAGRMLGEGLRVEGQSAWVRADGIVRDAASGSLAAQVRAGLNEVYLGVERPDAGSLAELGKTCTLSDVRAALDLLARDHPQVFTVGSFIYGLPGDTVATVRAIYRLSIELGIDKSFFIPLTPLPGTPFWRPEWWDPTGEAFRHHSFLPSAGRPGVRRLLDWTLLASFALDWHPARIRSYVRGFRSKDPRKRRMTGRLLARATRFSAAGIVRGLFHRRGAGGMFFPPWYES